MNVVLGCHSELPKIQECKLNSQQRDLGQSDSNDATLIIWAFECEIALYKSLLGQGDINPTILDKQDLILLIHPTKARAWRRCAEGEGVLIPIR